MENPLLLLTLLAFLACAALITYAVVLRKRVASLQNDYSRLEKVQSEFLANMSHELRTPITSLKGFTDLMLDWTNEDRLAYRYQDALNVMKRNETFLLNIVDSILTFGKLRAGIPVTDLSEIVSVREVIESVIDSLRFLAKQKKIELRFDCSAEVPALVRTSAQALRQIVANLVQNAIKFTDRGAVHVEASCAFVGSIVIDVTDTGIGIDPGKLQEIFKPFFQIESASARSFGGVGLGLAISTALAEQIRGSLEAESDLGKGSRFRLTFAAPAVAAPAAVEPAVLTKGTGAGRVILAEDTHDSRLVIGRFLERLHTETVAVTNGREAVNAIMEAERTENSFDLVLMDMQMPVMDGYQATRLLRQRGFKKPIIAVTAHNLPSDREKCIAAGCTDYIAKPLQAESFTKTVGHYLHAEHPA